MSRLFTALDKAFCAFVPVLLACMAVAIVLEISLREMISPLFGNPGWISTLSSPLNTMSQTLLVWTGLLGSSVAVKHRAHLGVDVLTRAYPPRVAVWVDRISIVIIALFSLVVCVYGGWAICAAAIKRGSVMPGFENVNRAWFYSVLVIGGLANTVYCVLHLATGRVAGEHTEGGRRPVEAAE